VEARQPAGKSGGDRLDSLDVLHSQGKDTTIKLKPSMAAMPTSELKETFTSRTYQGPSQASDSTPGDLGQTTEQSIRSMRETMSVFSAEARESTEAIKAMAAAVHSTAEKLSRYNGSQIEYLMNVMWSTFKEDMDQGRKLSLGGGYFAGVKKICQKIC
jgi:hypothetical protein